ncbi:hypothetical protein ROLI_000140 [Roseobacter fucihabitans]|uniref:Uncharacterized protein n=1 Tax=Roseobacter fucihabitans TaxID=1537242 RepID=A0ABZ2BLT1_9RHOB
MAVVRHKLMTDRPDVQKLINLTQYVIGSTCALPCAPSLIRLCAESFGLDLWR